MQGFGLEYLSMTSLSNSLLCSQCPFEVYRPWPNDCPTHLVL